MPKLKPFLSVLDTILVVAGGFLMVVAGGIASTSPIASLITVIVAVIMFAKGNWTWTKKSEK